MKIAKELLHQIEALKDEAYDPIEEVTDRDYRERNVASDVPRNLIDNCTVVLVRTSGPVNLGQICRCMHNLGMRPSQLRLVDPECEPNSSDARKFAVKSKDILLESERYESLVDAVKDCDLIIGTCGRDINKNTVQEIWTPEAVPSQLRRMRVSKYAVLFGSEANGLGTKDLQVCNACITIPSRRYSSFSLSQAVGIVLYTVFSSGGSEDPGSTEVGIRAGSPATFQETEMLRREWEDVLTRYNCSDKFDVREFVRNTPMASKYLHRLRSMFRHLQHSRGRIPNSR
mmetsp:Transcript_6840/g.16796  ORF Transcript_6840/g.16796 Transcript_6840/m.16796 type:complete len:286 (-) Transcript_6840:182-1039(-)